MKILLSMMLVISTFGSYCMQKDSEEESFSLKVNDKKVKEFFLLTNKQLKRKVWFNWLSPRLEDTSVCLNGGSKEATFCSGNPLALSDAYVVITSIPCFNHEENSDKKDNAVVITLFSNNPFEDKGLGNGYTLGDNSDQYAFMLGFLTKNLMSGLPEGTIKSTNTDFVFNPIVGAWQLLVMMSSDCDRQTLFKSTIFDYIGNSKRLSQTVKAHQEYEKARSQCLGSTASH